jgi:hypothetical protein
MSSAQPSIATFFMKMIMFICAMVGSCMLPVAHRVVSAGKGSHQHRLVTHFGDIHKDQVASRGAARADRTGQVELENVPTAATAVLTRLS